MKTYTVIRRIDAYNVASAKVWAKSPERATHLASENAGRYKWTDEGYEVFDARFYIALDEKGREIEVSREGDIC